MSVLDFLEPLIMGTCCSQEAATNQKNLATDVDTHKDSQKDNDLDHEPLEDILSRIDVKLFIKLHII